MSWFFEIKKYSGRQNQHAASATSEQVLPKEIQFDEIDKKMPKRTAINQTIAILPECSR